MIERNETMEYCLYGDESCHLENDGINSMALGCTWCNKEDKDVIARELRDLKEKHGLSPHGFELKWTSVSPSKIDYFTDVANYFFTNKQLNYRAIVVPDKSILSHHQFDQTHSEWLYKMWYECVKHVITNTSIYNIYIDISEHNSYLRSLKLKEILECKFRENQLSNGCIGNVQNVDSKQVEILQLADFLTGALGYGQRGLTSSTAKLRIVNLLRDYLQMRDWRTTRCTDTKFSILVWNP